MTPRQRRAVVGVIVAFHAAAGFALLHAKRAPRDAMDEPPPVYVAVLQDAAAAPVAMPVPPSVPLPSYQPVMPELTLPDVVAAPMPVPVSVPEPATPTPPATPALQVAAAPVAERILSASEVQYVEPPVLVYPRASRRAGEAGRVLLRVFVDEEGRPHHVQVSRSSGFARLDDAAVDALRKARFKPSIDNGRPVAGWALVPLTFELNA